jgi:hypothetical protein
VEAPVQVAASAVGRAGWLPAKVGALIWNGRLRSLDALLCRFVALVLCGGFAGRKVGGLPSLFPCAGGALVERAAACGVVAGVAARWRCAKRNAGSSKLRRRQPSTARAAGVVSYAGR